MAVSSSTVIQYYTGILRLTPSAAVVSNLSNLANETVLLQTLEGQATVNVNPIIRVYQAAFDRVPDSGGLTFYVQNYVNGGSTGTWTLSQIATYFSNSPEFLGKYGALSNRAYVSALYSNVLQRPGEEAGIQYWTAKLDLGASRGSVLLGFSESPEFQTNTLPNIQGFENACALGTQSYTGSLFSQGTINTFTLTPNADTFVGGVESDVFDGSAANTLSNFDSLTGGAGTDTLNAVLTGTGFALGMSISDIETANIQTSGAGFTGTVAPWTGLTTLNFTDAASGGVNLTGATTTAATINAIATAGSSAGNAYVVNGFGGALTVGVTGTAGAADGVTIGSSGANALTSVSVTGGAAVTIADKSGAAAATGSTLTTVSLNGTAGVIGITGNGLTTLNLSNETNAADDVRITAAAGARALTVNLNNVVGGSSDTISVTDKTATTLNINAVIADSGNVTAVAGAATSVNIQTTAAADLELDALTAGVATAVNISGAGATTVTADTLASNAVITSTATGGVVITQQLGTAQQFVGALSTGDDYVSVAASGSKAITTGAGDDEVVYGGALATGGSIDAGLGIDTITMTRAAAVAATGSTTFAGTVANFEILQLSNGATADSQTTTVNMANADGINAVELAAVTGSNRTGNTLAFTNTAANFTLIEDAAQTTGGSSNNVINIALANSVGVSDNVNFILQAANGFDSTALTTANGVERFTITTNDTDTTAPTSQFGINLAGDAVSSIVASGDTGLILTNTSTTLTSVNASGLTGTGSYGGLTFTSGALASAATILGGSAGTNTVDFSAAVAAVTYTGGTGADTINFASANALNNTITLGNGANYVYGNGGTGLTATTGNNTVIGGTGVDTIATGTGADTIVGGGGADVITAGAGADTITLSGNTSTIIQGATASGVNNATTLQTSVITTTFDVIYGAAAGDLLDLGLANGAVIQSLNLAAVDSKVVFAHGTYAAGVFTYSATGADTLVSYDSGSDNEAIVLVGYSGAATAATLSSGVVTLG